MVRCTWDRLDNQAAEQTAHPSAVRAGGRVLSSNGCTQIDEEPFLQALEGRRSLQTPRPVRIVAATSATTPAMATTPNAEHEKGGGEC
jgi:hypothetical protein